MAVSKEDIIANKLTMQNSIVQYVLDQHSLWLTVPYYALQADGVTGYSDNLGQAYANKMLYLRSSEYQGVYRWAINLDTGQLCWMGNRNRPVDIIDNVDDINSSLLDIDMDELDAAALIAELKNDAKGEPFFNSMSKEKRQKMMKEFDIKEIKSA